MAMYVVPFILLQHDESLKSPLRTGKTGPSDVVVATLDQSYAPSSTFLDLNSR